MNVVVMGVCGCGKTTVGHAIADGLGARFEEGDQFHPPENIEKMSRGTPLGDEDRWPWLRAIAAALAEHARAGRHSVVACSALKQAYRDVLADGRRDVHFVYLRGDRALIAARMAQRKHHFMPDSLIPSQFAALEEPMPGEHVLVLDVDQPPQDIAAAALAWLHGRQGGELPSRSAGDT